jgi:alpha-methylacyl-CoA racemase
MPGALANLKVLDVSMNLPGPYMTWLLARMGAEVIKVENPLGGDYARGLAGRSTRNAPYFEAVNRNKKSVTLNLKHEEGRRLFLHLLSTRDVLVEGFRPGTMDRLGLGYEEIHAAYPRVVYVSISGYGQDGPYRLRAGHDLNYISLAGIVAMTGTKEGQPVIPGVQIADIAGGSLMGLAGLLAAVIQREHTGVGQFVDVSMFGGVLSLATMVFGGVQVGLEEPQPGKMMLNGRLPCYGLYRTSDDRYMSLGALEFKFWQNFCLAVQRPDLIDGHLGGPEIVEEVQRIFSGSTQAQWIELMKDRDACCEPVLSLLETAASDLAEAGSMIERTQDGDRHLGFPLRFSGSLPDQDSPAPLLGQHTQEVLSQLGLSSEELDVLSRLGVI